MIPINKLFPWKDLVGKTIKDVERGENHGTGFGADIFRIYFEDGSDFRFGAMDGLVYQCGEGFDAKADFESFQANASTMP